MLFALCVVSCRGDSTPLFIQGSKVVKRLFLEQSTHSIVICMPSCTARRRSSREVSVGGQATPGVSGPLTRPSHHLLRVVGSGVGLDRSAVGTFPGCFDLMGFFYLLLCANQCWETPFGVFSHVFVHMSYKIIIFQIHVELGQW